jgi:uncharacterized Zn finger protein
MARYYDRYERYNYGYGHYKPYVPVAQRRAQAAKELAKRLKKGQAASPINIEGRTIASTFWGKAWCTNLESYSDYANRLPRGRTYARNGSVVHLSIEKGRIDALVSGSEVYDIRIDIAPLPESHWQAVKQQCAGQIGSLVELLQGKLSKGVMEVVTDRQQGLFPKPKEITLKCSCPDYAGMCKHLAAVMYGVGHRLDTSPELLFLLRGVDQAELIEQAIPAAPPQSPRGTPALAAEDLGAIFDIELDTAPPATAVKAPRKKPASKTAVKKAAPQDGNNAAKTAVKQTAKKAPKKTSAAKATNPAAPRKKAAAKKTTAARKKK